MKKNEVKINGEEYELTIFGEDTYGRQIGHVLVKINEYHLYTRSIGGDWEKIGIIKDFDVENKREGY